MATEKQQMAFFKTIYIESKKKVFISNQQYDKKIDEYATELRKLTRVRSFTNINKKVRAESIQNCLSNQF